MWIVLLDLSGSMGEPFAARDIEALGRIRSVEAQIKIDAAKKSFLLELKRLPASMQVVLFGFRSTVTEIYAGQASEVEEFERRLNELQPDNGTDIAVALKHLLNYANQRPQVLLISDGKSDLEKAKAEAHRCANAGIRVDMLIIDPTDEGLEMAKAIAGITQGRWDPVTSAEQLVKLAGEAGETRARDLARAEEFLSRTELEYQNVATQHRDKTRVAFSAGYPSRINPQRRYPLVVYIHLEELRETIEEYLKEEIASSGLTPACSNAISSTHIPRGTLVTVQPNIPEIFANPPRQDVVWLEDYHKLSFDIRYSGTSPSTSCAGFVDILADGVLIGHLPVSIVVESDSQVLPAEPPMIVIGNPFARVFASYSHQDDAVVQACKETYKAFGIHLSIDRDDLLSGQPWRDTLRKMIAKSDLFQLYWSQAAADSTEVAREWQLALDISKSRIGDYIRPLYWNKPLVTPPTELGHLHFAYLDLDKLRVAPKDVKTEKEDTSSPWQSIDATFPVISLVEEDESSGTIDAIQKSIGCVVPFLEHATELRYYPPTTLLVDEYVIKSIRSYLAVDRNQDSDSQEDEIGFALEILQSLALTFHVRRLDPDNTKYDDEIGLKRFYRINNDLEWNDFRYVRILCEYIFSHPVSDYLQGKDPFEQPDRTKILYLDNQGTTFQKCTSFYDYLDKWFILWVNYLDAARSQLNKIIKNDYTVPRPALDWLKMKFPNGRFEILSEKEPWTREGPPVCTWRISTDDIYRIVVFLNPIVLNAIQSGGGSTSPVKKYFTSMAHTYGIFANAESESTNQYLLKLARERNWPAGVALTGSHKVLLCTDALKRYKSALLDLGLNEQQADQTAAWFVIAILVHEHFHAIAATGLDKQGRTSWAVNNWNEWQLGNVLNESLAAWMEWHFFRNNDTMVSNITDYIHSGQYPDWPYRGADKIEEIYKSQGLPGVREWIWRLREDPQHAQESFDQVA